MCQPARTAAGRSPLTQSDVEFDLITSVPLHASRLQERGYNQAELIAQLLSRSTRLYIDEHCGGTDQPADQIGMDGGTTRKRRGRLDLLSATTMRAKPFSWLMMSAQRARLWTVCLRLVAKRCPLSVWFGHCTTAPQSLVFALAKNPSYGPARGGRRLFHSHGERLALSQTGYQPISLEPASVQVAQDVSRRQRSTDYHREEY